MNKPIILIRPALAEGGEVEAAIKAFGKENVFTSLASFIDARSKLAYTQIKPNVPVLARYSLLPNHKETEDLLKLFGDKVVNSYHEHRYIADLADWYQDLEDLTFKTYFRLEDVPKDGGPFVLKGETNSKKFQWNTHAYAKDYKAASEVYSRLCQDSIIGDQSIYIREYVPLKKLQEGFNGLPISEEYRFFVINGKLVSGGFYWASHVDDLEDIPDASSVPIEFLKQVIDRVDDACNFYVIDVARTATGEWKVVELNDGQQSGLSCIDPEEFYTNLSNILAADF
jgi:hypothetical protein